jgi:hypothetical protein
LGQFNAKLSSLDVFKRAAASKVPGIRSRLPNSVYSLEKLNGRDVFRSLGVDAP